MPVLRRAVLVLPVILLLASQSHAAEVKDTIRIGIFPESIYNLNFTTYSFDVNFWMWSVAKGDMDGNGVINADDSAAALDRINLIELSNAQTYSYSHQTATRTDTKNGTFWWSQQFCRATIYQKWKLDNYPFDKQSLRLKFESSSYDTSQVIMLNEMDSLTFKKDINLIGWKIDSSKIYSHPVTYNTDFGDPNGNGKSAYSRVTYIIQMGRQNATSYFIKLCLGVFISFMVAVLVFGISPSSMDSRFGLGIGSLFAAAANKYVVDNNIPETATNCLVDKVHEITFVYILVSLIASAISLRLYEKSKHEQLRRFDIAVGLVLLFSYSAIVIYYWIVATGRVPMM